MASPHNRTRWRRVLVGGAVVAVVVAAIVAWVVREETRKMRSDDPRVWDDAVSALERETVARPGAVLFVGSSSIRFWSTLHEDMAPLPVVQRGFGGARVGDVLFHAERLFAAPSPRAIVLFVGTNDIRPDAALAPSRVRDEVVRLIERVHVLQPGVPVHYILITPSARRWSVWPLAAEANALIVAAAARDPLWHIIDTGPALLEAGRPDERLFIFDGLHLNAEGYAVWTTLIRERLITGPDAGK